MNEITAKARVQVTVEVEASCWGEDCTIGQLHKQAALDGISEVRKLIVESKGKAIIVGNPKVIGIITER